MYLNKKELSFIFSKLIVEKTKKDETFKRQQSREIKFKIFFNIDDIKN